MMRIALPRGFFEKRVFVYDILRCSGVYAGILVRQAIAQVINFSVRTALT